MDVAKTLAGVGQNQRCFWSSFFVTGAVNFDNVLKGSKIAFCETVVEQVLDDFTWQVQHLGCLGFIFRGRCSTL